MKNYINRSKLTDHEKTKTVYSKIFFEFDKYYISIIIINIFDLPTVFPTVGIAVYYRKTRILNKKPDF